MFSTIAAGFYEAFMVVALKDAVYEIAFAAHIVGFLSGVVIGLAIYEEPHKKTRYTFGFIWFYATVAAIVYNIYPHLPEKISNLKFN